MEEGLRSSASFELISAQITVHHTTSTTSEEALLHQPQSRSQQHSSYGSTSASANFFSSNSMAHAVSSLSVEERGAEWQRQSGGLDEYDYIQYNEEATSLTSSSEEYRIGEDEAVCSLPQDDDPFLEHEPVLGSNNTVIINNSHSHNRKLSTVGLAVLIFYSVSGGPFGCEESVRSAGSFYTLLGFLVFPFVWSVQEALMTAELGTAFPEASGGVAWVEEAFGNRAGWMSGYLGWVAGATDNAIYPVLFLDYLLAVMKDDSDDDMRFMTRFLLLSTTAIALAYINWLGLNVVGNMSLGICVVAMSPFVVLTIVGAFQVDPRRWFEMPMSSSDLSDSIMQDTDVDEDDASRGIIPNAVLGGVLIRPYLNNLFWNLNSFDAAASFSADIDDPGRVLPRALFWSVIMIFLGYFLPLLVALGASDSSREDWVDGYLARAASDIVGPWLGAWMVLAAGISNIGLFQAELSADAFQLMGMADRGYLPKIFSKRSRHGTPTYGIILGTVVIVVMSVSNLDQLIEMLNFNYAISLLMEYFAFLKLRISRPELERPYRIPLNTFGCFLLFVPTIAITVAILGLASWQTYVFSFVCNLVGIALYSVMQRRQDDGPPPPPKSFFSLYQKQYSRVGVEMDSVTTASTTSNTAGSGSITPPSPGSIDHSLDEMGLYTPAATTENPHEE